MPTANVEDVVNDANWKSESEAAYKALGARKVVIGQANNVSFSQFKSDIDGKMYNKAEVTYSLKVYNIADGAMIGSEDLFGFGYRRRFEGRARSTTR